MKLTETFKIESNEKRTKVGKICCRLYCSDHLKNRDEFVFGCVLVFFVFQNQTPQIIIRMDRVICHIKALSLVIRTNLKKFVPVSRKTGLKLSLVSTDRLALNQN